MRTPLEQEFEAPTCSIFYIGLVGNNKFEEWYDIPVLVLKYDTEPMLSIPNTV